MSDDQGSKKEKPIEFMGSEEDQSIARATYSYREEANQAKRTRMLKNRENFDCYNLMGDFSHKRAGQSKEFLPKQSLATEQITSFMQQALIDAGDWWKAELEPGVKDAEAKIKPGEITKILSRQLDAISFDETVADGLKLGLLGSLMIAKVHGEYVNKAKFTASRSVNSEGNSVSELRRIDKKVWQLKVDLIRQEDWYPDPTTDNLYKIQQIEMDLHSVKKLSQGPGSIYNDSVVDELVGGFDDLEQAARRARETGQVMTTTTYRKRIRLWEGWGTIIDPSTGKVLHEDVTWTVANDRWLIQKPKPYPFWHGGDPFVVCPIIRVPKSVWHKAMTDAGTQLNQAVNEIFNLILDGGIMAVFGIKQVRPNCMVDETQISNGVIPGETYAVNELLPHGEKFIESVGTGGVPQEALSILNVAGGEFNQSMLTNDLRMGQVPDRAVKATEVVEASQTITSVFTGITKIIEQNFILEVLKKAWMTAAQNMNDMDSRSIEVLLGKDRAQAIAAMSPEERFAATADGIVFKVFGISKVLSKMKEFKKLTALLQTISGSEVLIEEFAKRYDFGNMLKQIMEALDIDTDELEIDPAEREAMAVQNEGPMQPGGAQPGTQPNAQSNIPQMGSSSMGQEGNPGGPQPTQGQGGIPQAHFPPSRATPTGGAH